MRISRCFKKTEAKICKSEKVKQQQQTNNYNQKDRKSPPKPQELTKSPLPWCKWIHAPPKQNACALQVNLHG